MMLSDLQYCLRCAVCEIFRLALSGALTSGRSYVVRPGPVISILALLIAPLPASGQAQPTAPQQLCIEEVGGCESADGDAHKAVKWNPGHYIKTQGNQSQGDVADYVSSVTRQLAKTGHSPKILGAQVHYAWGMIEPTLGTYNWEPIYTHLNYLSARGKKLILAIDVKCFRNDCPSLAPAELASEVFLTPRANPTRIIEIWEKPNMDLFIAFWQALGAEFDGNPDLEMVLGSESTPSLQGGSPENFTRSGYAAQLKRIYAAQRAAFETTNVIANINFLSNQLSGLIEQAYQVGAGRGMPDVGDSAGSYVFRGQCDGNDCGVRDYRGLIPHLAVASTSALSSPEDALTDTPAEVIAYGLVTKVTHYSWVSTLDNEDSWNNIITAIEGMNPNGHVACPTRYAGGCK